MRTILKGGPLGAFLLLPWLALTLGSMGCRSFLRDQAMKDYPVKIQPMAGLPAPNRYQEDFLYLKTLGQEVVPLEDRYFPPSKRAAMEQKILQELGRPDCSYETFLFDISSYLGAFNNQHATVADNPRPLRFSGLYPFKVHYVGNDLYVSDIARDYDRSLLGQKITALGGQPILEVEQKLAAFESAENPWTKKTSLEPFGYSRPEIDRFIGVTSSVSNNLELEFAGHPPVWIAPKWKGDFGWQSVPRPPHLITARSEHLYDFRIFPEQNLAYFQFNACFDKTAILGGLDMVRPWVRTLIRAWLDIQFHRKKPFDVMKGIYDPGRPILKDYLASEIGNINRLGITNLIIDLRNNGGGERELTKQLIYYLTHRADLRDSKVFEYNPKIFAYYDPDGSRKLRSWYQKKFGTEPPFRQLLPTPEQELPFFAHITDPKLPCYIDPDRPVFSGKIIVLVNQNTASAASFLTGLIQDNKLAVIVGTTVGNNPTGPTTFTSFKLPRSGIMISLPSEYFERALPSNGDILQPDYWVENSVADIQTGRDAAFEKALELLHLSNAISMEKMDGAVKFLRSLKNKGQLPGWSKNDKGALDLESYSASVTFGIRKNGDTSTYHYTVIQSSNVTSWKLQKAWRTDNRGRRIKDYPVS